MHAFRAITLKWSQCNAPWAWRNVPFFSGFTLIMKVLAALRPKCLHFLDVHWAYYWKQPAIMTEMKLYGFTLRLKSSCLAQKTMALFANTILIHYIKIVDRHYSKCICFFQMVIILLFGRNDFCFPIVTDLDKISWDVTRLQCVLSVMQFWIYQFYEGFPLLPAVSFPPD